LRRGLECKLPIVAVRACHTVNDDLIAGAHVSHCRGLECFDGRGNRARAGHAQSA
jgi:hypothetical protein